jgi:hypothetical protein
MFPNISCHFFTKSLSFGIGENKQGCYLKPDGRVELIKVLNHEALKAQCSSLNAVADRMNGIIGRLHSGTCYSIRGLNLIRFYENMQSLDQKIQEHNAKVENSFKVRLIHTILKIVSLGFFNFKARYYAAQINYQVLNSAYEKAQYQQQSEEWLKKVLDKVGSTLLSNDGHFADPTIFPMAIEHPCNKEEAKILNGQDLKGRLEAKEDPIDPKDVIPNLEALIDQVDAAKDWEELKQKTISPQEAEQYRKKSAIGQIHYYELSAKEWEQYQENQTVDFKDTAEGIPFKSHEQSVLKTFVLEGLKQKCHYNINPRCIPVMINTKKVAHLTPFVWGYFQEYFLEPYLLKVAEKTLPEEYFKDVKPNSKEAKIKQHFLAKFKDWMIKEILTRKGYQAVVFGSLSISPVAVKVFDSNALIQVQETKG